MSTLLTSLQTQRHISNDYKERNIDEAQLQEETKFMSLGYPLQQRSKRTCTVRVRTCNFVLPQERIPNYTQTQQTSYHFYFIADNY